MDRVKPSAQGGQRAEASWPTLSSSDVPRYLKFRSKFEPFSSRNVTVFSRLYATWEIAPTLPIQGRMPPFVVCEQRNSTGISQSRHAAEGSFRARKGVRSPSKEGIRQPDGQHVEVFDVLDVEHFVLRAKAQAEQTELRANAVGKVGTVAVERLAQPVEMHR